MGIEDIDAFKEDIKKFHKFEDYVRKHARHLAMSFEDMVELSDQEFESYYLSLNESKRFTHGWWEPLVPHCDLCGEDIPGPRELRMYEGMPYHPDCLPQVLVMERFSELSKRYWEKVLRVGKTLRDRGHDSG